MGNGQPEVLDELTRRGFTDIAVIGRGGHATVYRAEQPAFGRSVAVKVLTDADLDPVAFERFERERRASGSMSNHPNILTVYEGGVTRTGQAFLVTEYAPRGNLAERVARRGAVPWPEAVVTGIKLAGALETAHRLGVIHRDVKPENVLLSDYGEPLLGDFGIARITGGFVTSTTIIRASVAHVPPEVLAGERPRPSTDVYSLASTILTVIWGRPPFFAEDEPVATLSDRIAREAPPDLRTRGVPGAVCRVLERGLAKRPSDRPPSALAFGEELRAAQRAMGQAVTPLPLVAGDADEPLTGAGDATAPPVPRGIPAPPTVGARHDAARRRRHTRFVRAGVVAGVLAVVGGAAGAAVVLRGGDGEAVAVPNDGLAAAGDRLFVVGGSGGGARLAVFSLPDRRLTEGPPGLPTGVVAVAADGRSTWVLNEEGVHRLADEGIGQSQPIDGWPVAVEIDEDQVWLLDVKDEELVLGSFAVDGGPEALEETVGPAGEDGDRAWRGALAVDADEVWVTDGRGILARRLPRAEELERVQVDGDVVDLAIDPRFVWAGTRDGRLLRIDRASLDRTSVQVSESAVVEVVAGGGHVWTADEEGVVRRVAGDDRGATAATLDAGRKVLALSDDGAVLYVVNAETGVVDQVDASTGEIDAGASIDLTDALD